MAQIYELSQEAHDRLRSELDDLTSRGRIEIAKKIETAREMGDLSENGDYHAAKEEQGKMEGRINHLTGLLEDCVITGNSPLVAVRAGCVVSVRFEGDDEVEKFLIGSIEERREGVTVMSPGSPMGTALIGSQKGDVVSYESPVGTLSVTVIDFEA